MRKTLVLLLAGLAVLGTAVILGADVPGLRTLRDWVVPGAQRDAPASSATAVASGPPPEVGVLEVRLAEVPVPVEYAGRIVGFREVEVRPRVSGLLLRREYEEGSRVREGQVLFRIDPAPYEVAQRRAEAQASQAQASLRQAEENLRRIEELFRRGVATEKQRDDAQTARDQAQASVQLAQAEIEGAKLNLGYTTVTAPVSGVTALQSPSIGTLIQAQQTLLTTVTPLDPAYASYSFTDVELQRFRALNARRSRPIRVEDLAVELHFGGGEVYGHQGRIDTAAQRVDPLTGTIQARAIFPNPDGALLPGQFVRVVIHGITIEDAIVIPRTAVLQGPQGPSVFVVGENGTAQARPIRIAQEVAQGLIVEDGFKPGERVVVEGVIRVRPGAAVRSVAVEGGPMSPPASGGQAGAADQAAPAPTATGSTRGAATERDRDARSPAVRRDRP